MDYTHPIDANVKTVLYLCLQFLRERERKRGRERLVRNMCRRLQCEKDSIEVWWCDVSLCQGYVAIWPALAMIRLKYKVLWSCVCVCVCELNRQRELSQTQQNLSGLDFSRLGAPTQRNQVALALDGGLGQGFTVTFDYKWKREIKGARLINKYISYKSGG